MTPIRAKFYCQSVTQHAWSDVAKTYRFSAVYDQGLAEEDCAFAKATPTGSLDIQVDNPSAQFEVGKYYYLDLTLVED